MRCQPQKLAAVRSPAIHGRCRSPFTPIEHAALWGLGEVLRDAPGRIQYGSQSGLAMQPVRPRYSGRTDVHVRLGPLDQHQRQCRSSSAVQRL